MSAIPINLVLTKHRSSTSSTTPIATVLPLLGPFYLQVATAEASNAVIIGSCGLWDSVDTNGLVFASASWSVANRPLAYYLHQTTGYLSTADGQIAGTALYCFDECDSLAFVRSYTAADFSADSAIQPLVCTYNGLDGGSVTCTQRRRDGWGQTYDYGVVGYQYQDNSGVRLLTMGTFYTVPYQLRGVRSIQSCVGATGSG